MSDRNRSRFRKENPARMWQPTYSAGPAASRHRNDPGARMVDRQPRYRAESDEEYLYGLGRYSRPESERIHPPRYQYPAAGMRSDFDPGQGYRLNRRDEEDRLVYYPRSGYVGYDEEGAFYQDLDEPYSYEYWEVGFLSPGEFTGVGPEEYHRSDENLKEEINERLTMHGRIDARKIQVDVSDGNAILRGSVPQNAMKLLAERAAESVTGVTNVENHIKVERQERSGSAQIYGGGRIHAGARIYDRSRNRYQKEAGRPYFTGAGERIREGMDVVGLDGMVVGRVKEVGGDNFTLDREMARDLHVPFDAIDTVGRHVMLNIPSTEISSQDWQYTELF